MAENRTLRGKRGAFVQALLTRGTVRAAAQAAGVAESTAYRYLRSPEVRAALQAAEQDALATLQRRLVSLGSNAGDVLEQAMRPGEDLRHRLRASGLVLDNLLRLRELLELERRISELERRLEVRNGH